MAGKELLQDDEPLHNPESGFRLNEFVADLFVKSPSHAALGHCVSVDLHMGKGIAVQFKSRFGQVPHLHSQNPQVGGVVWLKHQDRYVYYLISKTYYYNKPTYAYVIFCVCWEG